MIEIYKFGVSLLPVFAFLVALIFLDSFKLVSYKAVLYAIGWGLASAILSMVANEWLIERFDMSVVTFRRYPGPAVEEIVKSFWVVWLIRSQRVGFPVDAAISGFAVGAGFGFLENLYYLQTVETNNILVWIVRGFGTAALHSGTVAIFGIISRSLSDRHERSRVGIFLPGLLLAFVIHSAYNHFFLSPVTNTLVLLVALPIVLIVVFDQSERATRSWLGEGFDADIEMLDSISTGEISDTHVGQYLGTLYDKFPGPVVADMLCLLRIHLELALEAKGLLMAQEAGLKLPVDPETKEKFAELKYLEKSVGQTGLWALKPFLFQSSRDLWQRHMLER